MAYRNQLSHTSFWDFMVADQVCQLISNVMLADVWLTNE